MLLDSLVPDTTSEADPAFRADVLAGLAMKPRAIPARWLYDRAGRARPRRATASSAPSAGPARCSATSGNGR